MYEKEYKARKLLAPLLSEIPQAQRYHRGLRPGEVDHVACSTDKYRFMAACRLPFYDRNADTADAGISCGGCQLAMETHSLGECGERWAITLRDMVYGNSGYLAHFRRCAQAQRLWTSSEHGTVEPKELPAGVRHGGYFSCRE